MFLLSILFILISLFFSLFFGRFQIDSQGIIRTASTTLPENGIFNLKVKAKETGNKVCYLKSRILLHSLKGARLFTALEFSILGWLRLVFTSAHKRTLTQAQTQYCACLCLLNRAFFRTSLHFWP